MSEATETTTNVKNNNTKGKTPKKPAKAKATTGAKSSRGTPATQGARAAVADAKAMEAKRRKEERASFVTFAFRLPKSESAALHKAAGPANASRVMRALAGAFVTGDRAVFEQIVEDAKKLQA